MCTAHLILLDLITWIIFGDKYTSLNSSLFILPHSPVSRSLLGPNNLLSALFSNNLSLCSSFNVSDQAANSYKTTGKTIVLCILIFKFWIANYVNFKCKKNSKTFLFINLYITRQPTSRKHTHQWLLPYTYRKDFFWKMLKTVNLHGMCHWHGQQSLRLLENLKTQYPKSGFFQTKQVNCYQP